MNIMASREECVTAINSFIKTQNPKDALTLFKYLCEVKDVDNKEELINNVINNPAILSVIVMPTIDTLMIELSINKVSDKYNPFITVF